MPCQSALLSWLRRFFAEFFFSAQRSVFAYARFDILICAKTALSEPPRASAGAFIAPRPIDAAKDTRASFFRSDCHWRHHADADAQRYAKRRPRCCCLIALKKEKMSSGAKKDARSARNERARKMSAADAMLLPPAISPLTPFSPRFRSILRASRLRRFMPRLFRLPSPFCRPFATHKHVPLCSRALFIRHAASWRAAATADVLLLRLKKHAAAARYFCILFSWRFCPCAS